MTKYGIFQMNRIRITILFLTAFSLYSCKIRNTANQHNDHSFNKVPKIKIISNDWGTGNQEDIHAVLKSVSEIIFPLGGQASYNPIMVGRSENGPIVLYRRGPNEQYIINLNTQDRYWCQYAFQFSHEIGHILCGYKDGDSSNLWFEETLAEVASLFVLRRLEEKWQNSPPYPEWEQYAPEFTKYAENRIQLYKDEIPNDLNQWIDHNAEELKTNPTNRKRNVSVAIRLLPVFENFNDAWAACMYLNKKKSKKEISFQEYIRDWYHACPHLSQKKVVEIIASKLHIKLPMGK